MSSFDDDNSPGPSTSRKKRAVRTPRKRNRDGDRMDVIEEEDDSGKTYIKPELRARVEDVTPTSVHVLASLHKNDEALTVTLPRLPEIPPIINYNDPLDYRDYNGRLSSMFAIGAKKTRKEARAPPSPSLENKCPLCPWSFLTPSALSRHVDTHYDMGVYVCQACLAIFNHSMNIYEHWRYNCTIRPQDYTMPAKEVPVHRLRQSVFTRICSANHTNMFTMFDGQMFIPSEQFLANPNNIVMQQHVRTCHFCALDVPSKFLECHGDVHRGRFRIDKAIYGHYFCHLCAMVFQSKETLLFHWRSKCSEVIVHTPDEYVLDDDELTALAFLVLQQTVSHKKMASMMEYSMFFLRKMMREHAVEHELLAGVTSTYYYFPQEIWPMQVYAGHDVMRDAFPLADEIPFAEFAGRVHNCNLLATVCPDFYATGMEFNEIRVPLQDGKHALLRTVLRFSTSGSIIKTYKINGRALPRLRPKFTIDGVRANYCNTDVQVDECSTCKEERITAVASKFRHQRHMQGVRHKNFDLMSSRNCPICKVLCIHSNEEHWQSSCAAIQKFVAESDWKYADEKFVAQLADTMKRNDVTSTLTSNKTALIKGSDNAIQKIREQAVKDIEKAKSREQHIRMVVERAREPENEEMVAICPHCGGKYHADELLAHMEHRHGYGEDADELYHAIKNWKQTGCRNSYQVFNTVVKRLEESGKPVAPIMTEEQYENASNFVFCKDAAKKFNESPWVLDETRREMSIVEPLLLLTKPIGTKRRVVRVDVAREPYYPESTEDENRLAGYEVTSQWLRLPRRARRLDPNTPIDPFTGRAYPEHLAAIVRAQSETFFGNSKNDLKRMGLNVNFIADLFGQADDDEEEDYRHEYSDPDDASDGGGVRASSEEEEEEEEDGDGGEGDGESDGGEGARRQERRWEDVTDALKKQKDDSKQQPKHRVYNPAAFAPEPQAVHPRHRNMEKYLTKVVCTDRGGSGVDISGEPLALNLMLENKLTVVHDDCRQFREKYLAQFPHGETNQNYLPAKLANKRFKMFDYTTFAEDQLQAIVDDSNVCFVGGLILPKSFEVDNLHYFYIRLEDPPIPPEREVMALKLRVYSARDQYGDFKYAWPARNERVINQKYFNENKEQSRQPNHNYALPLTRVELIKNRRVRIESTISVSQRLFSRRPNSTSQDEQAGMIEHGMTGKKQEALLKAIRSVDRGEASTSEPAREPAQEEREEPAEEQGEEAMEQ